MAQPKFSKLKNDAADIATRLLGFNVDFYDEAKFKYFVDNHMVNLFHAYDEICISGHFSEGFAELITSKLEELRDNVKLRLLTRSTGTSSIESLRKIQDAGAEIRYNRRAHFRMFVCKSESQGYLILGSFDFNKEGMTMDRRDAGISTHHPDLVQSAYKYFMKIWEDKHDSIPLDEKFPDERKKAKEQKTPEPEPEPKPENHETRYHRDPNRNYRRAVDSEVWHWCTNCSNWPKAPQSYTESKFFQIPFGGQREFCTECLVKEQGGTCVQVIETV